MASFSIIIPTYNRPKELYKCLNSIERLDFSKKRLEGIVVDDGSDLSLRRVTRYFKNQFSIKLIKQSHAGPASARNLGAEHATGDFLVFTDDDCLMTPNFLSALEKRFESNPENVIGGKTINALQNNPYSTASQMIIDAAYNYYNADSGNAKFFASNNMAVPSALFRSIGGFNAEFWTSEDREFCDRWLWRGYKMTYAPEILIHHTHQLRLRTFLRQHYNYGRGAFRFHLCRTKRQGLPMSLESKGFYAHLLFYPLFKAGYKAGAFEALLLLSQVASLLGYLKEKRSWRWTK
ncbi:MAG: glycosyltransferase family 2 protein [Thermodesulfobacteriota bacterium]